MTQIDANQPIEGGLGRGTLPVLLLVVVGSGCAALIYEIVWFQLLQFVIGSSGVSLAVLLGTFMGGMCLGSLLLPRLVARRRHPLLVYAALEFGIGVCGLLVHFGLPYVDRTYAALAGHGALGILVRAVVCALCLLLPAALMGGTLPAVARLLEAMPRSTSWIGFFYAANIAGAVFGCLLAAFYLLRVFDMETAAFTAVKINAAAALVAFVLAKCSPRWLPATPSQTTVSDRSGSEWPVYVVIALSGFCGLAAQVVWTRLLSLMLGGTVYAFAIILATFLIGLGIGSAGASLLATTRSRSRALLGICQLLLAIAIAWAAYALTTTIPYWPIVPSLAASPWLVFQLDLIRCLWAILPATTLLGASFPLALGSVSSAGRDPGRVAGAIYAANTAGAILGAIGGSLYLIPELGTQVSHRLLVGISFAAGLLLLLSFAGSSRWGTAQWVLRIGGGLSVAWLFMTIGKSMPPVPGELVAWGRQLPQMSGPATVLYMGEGESTSVAVVERRGERSFHVGGKPEASNAVHDMRLQRMLGHLPALIHPNPRTVLVIGCGMGATAGSFVPHPEIERIVICEIERLVPKAAATYFGTENHHVLSDPRVQVVYDDGRHFLQSTVERFDIITTDPMHPWIRGSATLYTSEFFELCKHRLNPSGIVAQWVPLYETDAATVKSEIATFFEAFPDGTLWGNTYNGQGYDAVLIGRNAPGDIDADAFRQRLNRPDHSDVVQSLAAVELYSALDVLRTYAGNSAGLSPWLHGADINRDGNLRLQYLAGMSSNIYRSPAIYAEILEYRSYPESFGLARMAFPKRPLPTRKPE